MRVLACRRQVSTPCSRVRAGGKNLWEMAPRRLCSKHASGLLDEPLAQSGAGTPPPSARLDQDPGHPQRHLPTVLAIEDVEQRDSLDRLLGDSQPGGATALTA